MKTINVLWTGGLDSTYLVTVLSRIDNVIIKPYYVLDEYRASTSFELKAISEITMLLRNCSETKAAIEDLQIVNTKQIEADRDVTESYLSLRKRHKLGSQYDYLARLAKQHHIRFAVGLQVGERSKVGAVFESEGKFKKDGEDSYSVLIVDEDKSSKDVVNVFSHFEIPTFVYKHSKLDEVEGFKQMGLETVMRKTWFCHSPINGMPCGQCSPCKDALHEGLAWRVPLMGRVLGYLVMPYRLVKKAYRKYQMLHNMGK